jgi:omega-6 fatty acid desaturase (delta-12 desaturase)
VNTSVPRLISLLHSSSEFHLVHHISPAIPSYRMRDAHEALMRSPYRALVREVPFSLSSFLHLTRRLHVWDSDSRSYLTLAEWRQRRG